MHRGKVAVRKIVEFILRRGDIDNRRTSNHTAQEGARLHRKLQQEAGEGYQKEVFLKLEAKSGEDQLIIEGRADGIFKEEHWVVDEIKTSEIQFEDLGEDQIELFFAQGMVYAYIYANEQSLDAIDVQLSYFQTTEQLLTKQKRHFIFSELEKFFQQLLAEYHKWLVFQDNWRRVRNTSLELLKFPYESYRKGQRDLAVAAYKTLKSSSRLFVEAPTGTGKTISTLFPALKAMGENGADRTFYLTAKTITRQVAEDALKSLADNGSELKSVTLTAKDKICFLDERNCTPEHCPYANGYYNRINETLWDLLHHENEITREVIELYGKKHTVCPFELSLDVSIFCDVIIGDYNYLFDPNVYLRRFFEETDEDYFFLIDEAHNLVSRSREMYSASVTQEIFEKLKNALTKKDAVLKRSVNKVLREFEKIKKVAAEDNWQYHHQKAPNESLQTVLYKLSDQLKEWLAANPEDSAEEVALSCYFDVLHYLKISEYYDDHYETTVEISKYDLKIRQFCIEPAPFLEQMLNKGKASLLFSASLTPLNYYQEVLGGGEAALRYRLPSPFAASRQNIIIANYIKTTYRKREESLPKIANILYQMVTAKKGNYMVFFPSYRYLDEAYALFHEQYPEINCLIQDSLMNETERERFLAKFQIDPSESLLAFCVLGGIFSEGIDLKGTRLIGTAIAGVGLPQINHEQELIREYYDEKKHAGFGYAYQLPGMNKVLQAAGRVIRDAQDYGVVLLMDQRFSSNSYRRFFPEHWQHAVICSTEEQITRNLLNFWQTTK